VSPTVNLVLDAGALVFAAGLVASTVSLIAAKKIRVDAGAVMLCLFAVLIAALMSNCASPTPTLPLPTVTTKPPPASEFDFCLAIVDAGCLRMEQCGGGSAHGCFAANAAQCADVFGITETEALPCVEAMRRMPCLAEDLPEECRGIAEPEPEAPQPRGVSI
jgi:hypothetical protein